MNEENVIIHKHHKIPKHMGGTDDSSNLEELTIEDHAEAHRLLWEQFGKWQDWLAWKSLSNQIPVAEIRTTKARLIQNQMIETGEHKFLNVNHQSMVGKASQQKRRKNGSYAFDMEWQRKNSLFFDPEWQSKIIRRVTAEGRNPLSRHNQTMITCVGCGKTMNKGNFVRWKHGEGCVR